MAIETHCPTCFKAYHVADEQRGKRVRCKQCNDNFLVKDESSSGKIPSRDDDRSPRKSSSRGRRRSRDYDEEDRPRSRGSNSDNSVLRVVLVIGLVLALPIIAVVVVMVIFFATVASKFPNPTFPAPIARNPPIVLPPNPRPDPNPVIPQPQPQPQPQPPGVDVRRNVDLMGLIDPTQDAIHGRWLLANKTLQCPEGNFVPRIQIPYQPPQEYDFVVEFSQPGLRNGISLIMPKPTGGSFFWFLGSNDGSSYGFGGNPNIEGRAPGLIEVNKRYTTTVQVRRDGVRGLVNGKELINHRTNFQDLSSDNWRAIRDTSLLAVACDDPTVFYTIQLVEMNGNGKRTR
jgi:DNA-directed RNA polymerase subunit RPC12/RpoP